MAYNSICILGRQPALGLAELESLYGSETVTPLSDHVAGIALPTDEIDFARLGGATKLANVLGEVPSTNWKMVEKALVSLARSSAFVLPTSGKLHLGLSAIGFDVSPAKLGATGLTLKKVIRGRYEGSVRLAPNVTAELSSAQVFHNHLVGENGCELLIIAKGNTTIVARTVAVQDIDSYTLRDRGRPKRDARVGMLPPKLAQIIINLAVSGKREGQVLDPFCGTGVVLQEALLMGYNTYGTDLEPRMISYSRQNLEWLDDKWKMENGKWKIAAGDATTFAWKPPIDAVAGETYLGRPFTAPPSREVLEQTVSEVNTILKKFLANIHTQLAPGARLCLGVPAWQTAPNRFRHLSLIDQLADLGYSRVSFTHVTPEDLVYYREDQVVGRELLVLTCI